MVITSARVFYFHLTRAESKAAPDVDEIIDRLCEVSDEVDNVELEEYVLALFMTTDAVECPPEVQQVIEEMVEDGMF